MQTFKVPIQAVELLHNLRYLDSSEKNVVYLVARKFHLYGFFSLLKLAHFSNVAGRKKSRDALSGEIIYIVNMQNWF